MIEKIRFDYIIKAYLKCFRDSDGNKNYGDYLLFTIFPGIIAVLLIFYPLHLKLTEKILSTLLSIISLSVPLLISVLVLMYNLGQNTKSYGKTNDKKIQIDVAEETLSYIMIPLVPIR